MQVKIVSPFIYDGVDRKAGEVFDMPEVHANLLSTLGKITTVAVDDPPPDRRSRYKRRDLRAEG